MLVNRLHKIAKKGSVRTLMAMAAVMATFGFGTAAQSQTVTQVQNNPEKTDSTEAFKLDMPAQMETPEFISLSSSLKGLSDVRIDLPVESVGSKIFDLDVSNVACMTGEEGCLSRDERLDMRYSKSLTTSIDTLLDIELTPRASMRFGDESSSAVVGALVRIGDDLKDNEEFKSNTWYMFAGADAEAVTYAPNSIARVTEGNFHLQDRIIVGDAQAGVGYRIGDKADISLGYFRREVTSFGNETNMERSKYTEDAAALSLTWRR